MWAKKIFRNYAFQSSCVRPRGECLPIGQSYFVFYHLRSCQFCRACVSSQQAAFVSDVLLLKNCSLIVCIQMWHGVPQKKGDRRGGVTTLVMPTGLLGRKFTADSHMGIRRVMATVGGRYILSNYCNFGCSERLFAMWDIVNYSNKALIRYVCVFYNLYIMIVELDYSCLIFCSWIVKKSNREKINTDLLLIIWFK